MSLSGAAFLLPEGGGYPLRRVDVRGVTVTARADMPGYDVIARFFAPGSGALRLSALGV